MHCCARSEALYGVRSKAVAPHILDLSERVRQWQIEPGMYVHIVQNLGLCSNEKT